ncbi:MAG: DNA repair protein RecN [Bacteroidales bacterium]|nr:DNA repair protein RecN [Bacteroidales bacterium]
MLKHLTIKNYALIESLEADFHHGFSVITGETGAGKSIILGALGLILGQRADLQSLMDKNEKCIVEGFFNIDHLELKSFFDENSLDYDPSQAILRREILPSGKSRAFINDTPVNLNLLKELAEKLVDIHSQNRVTSLQDEGFQLAALDNYAGLGVELQSYREVYDTVKSLKHNLGALVSKEAEAAREQDFYRFQLEELETARLVAGEQEQTEEELKLLTHAEEIKTRLHNAAEILDREHGLIDMIQELMHEVKPVRSYYSDIETVYNTIESSLFELKEASLDLGRVGEKLDVDPERVIQLNERLNTIYHLQHKHRTDSVDGLLKVKDEYAGKIAAYSSLNEQIEHLKNQISELESELQQRAELISAKRHSSSSEFESEIIKLIEGLGMPLARFSVNILPINELTPDGLDHVSFLFNANKGGELQELARVASGGELSRLLLAIKSVNTSRNLISTIIFDEIDSGVSGEVAGKMGNIMQIMARTMQVISITHIPQIAARGAHHYVVYKETGDEQTKTYIRQILREERIVEIAKMLSDTTVTVPALETAKELLKN